MLTQAENERLTRVGPGTPMGTLMRRYWQPALLSSELPEPDGAPVRVRLLGEDLVAFRDTNGDVGLVDAFCPHRRAPMFFGRNEECGLRCVYHGWKFDRDGHLRRHAERTAGLAFQDQGAHRRVSDARSGRHHLDVYGSARTATARARLRIVTGAENAPPRFEDVRASQLAAGARGRDRHLALVVLAQSGHPQQALSAQRRYRAAHRSRKDVLRLPLCGHPCARATTTTCASITT